MVCRETGLMPTWGAVPSSGPAILISLSFTACGIVRHSSSCSSASLRTGLRGCDAVARPLG